ncbi:hypothetical protein, partial [Salmonella enterica]|uniref:hypothetical protein n=1 Tax=Salmonella enterica TaxID=28901 RepID=UPI001EE93950
LSDSGKGSNNFSNRTWVQETEKETQGQQTRHGICAPPPNWDIAARVEFFKLIQPDWVKIISLTNYKTFLRSNQAIANERAANWLLVCKVCWGKKGMSRQGHFYIFNNCWLLFCS